MENDSFVDYYELLMISESADLQMLEASVRVMLARYSPKNAETGDRDTFELVKKAYLTLSDPEQRRQFDEKRERLKQSPAPAPLRPLEEAVSSAQIEREKLKRRGVMTVLYQSMVTRSHEPSVAVPHIADRVGIIADELQFAFWFLREQGFISRCPNGNFQITAKGVAWVEDGGLPHQPDAMKAVFADDDHDEAVRVGKKAPAGETAARDPGHVAVSAA